MSAATEKTDLFLLLQRVISSVPAREWLLAAALGAVVALYGYASWALGWKPSAAAAWLILVCLVVAVNAVTYHVCMGTVGLARTMSGGLRFVATLIVSVIPLLAGLAAVVALSKGSGWLIIPSMLALFSGLVIFALLQAWPPIQAVSPRFVRPTRVLAATKGDRLRLVFAIWILGGINGLTPSIGPSDSAVRAAVVSALDAAVGAVSIVIYACLHVAAWTLAARRDPGLGPPAGDEAF